MKIYIYFTILVFIISCSANNGVYWCGDHACANNKEKEAYFKKTMIVELRNLDKNNTKQVSANERIINQSENKEIKVIISEEELDQEIKLEEEQIEKNEKEIEEHIKLQERERAKEEKKLKEQIKLEEDQKLNVEKKEQKTSSSLVKVVEIKEIRSKNFDELVNKILKRNSSRSYPKINDIPK